GYPADLYLEGSDQHRGWFQLSLLPALGVTGVSPFRSVLTHGFMVDAEGRKMSKSTGNAIQVEDVLKQHGADVCRWWVSSLNYSNDIKVDWEFFQIAGEEYRKIRNTIRFLLGNLQDFDPSSDRYVLTEKDRYTVDAWAMGQLASLVASVGESYEKYQFKRVAEATFNFCNDAMSAVYLTAVKDRLYCDEKTGVRRRRTQSVIYDIASALIRIIAPIMVHTAEEAWLALKGLDMESNESVHLQYLPEKIVWEEAAEWADVMELRREVMKAFEDARERIDGLKNPLDAGVIARVPAEKMARIQPFSEELADLCSMSRFQLEEGMELSIEIQDLRNEPRCERSWKRDGTVRVRSDGSLLSDRDARVLGV
ncbi:MAG TPA: class I tRNA ligase family protein, partial [Acidobacteriota bacterium]|nr:class I tRNA ligase family protein [Acidobacteriota bacterium]